MRLFLIILALLIVVPNAYAFGKSANNAKTTLTVQETQKKYTFEDDTMRGKVVKLKKGTALPVVLLTPIDTSTAKSDDEVIAALDEDLVFEGTKIAEKGSVLYGKITNARSASKFMRGGKATIDFDKLVTTENITYKISAEEIKFTVQEESPWITAGHFVLMLVAVAAYTILTGGTGLAAIVMCAAVGIGSGAAAKNTKGPDAIIPDSTPMEVTLDSSLNVMAVY